MMKNPLQQRDDNRMTEETRCDEGQDLKEVQDMKLKVQMEVNDLEETRKVDWRIVSSWRPIHTPIGRKQWSRVD